MVRRILFFLVLAAALTASLFWSQRQQGPLQVSGFIEGDEIRVGSRVGGRVARVLVEEGQVVTAGALLVELEPFDLAEQAARARAELGSRRAELGRLTAGFRAEEIAQAAARRDQLAARLELLVNGPRPQEIEVARAEVRLAESKLELAGLEHERAKNLEADSVASRNSLDRAKSDLEVARATLDVQQQILEELEEGTRKEDIARATAELAEGEAALELVKNGYRAEDVEMARSAVTADEAALASIERRIEELSVRAPIDGVVETVRLRPGDLVAPDAPVLSLLDPSRLWVRAYVPQSQLVVKPGDIVMVKVDAFPARTFRGRIGFIAREAEFTPRNVQTPEERGEQVFRIKVYLEEGLDVLLPGVAADVVIESDD